MAGKSKVSRLFTAGNRAARVRRSTMRWWRSMSSSSARRSRYWGWSTPSAAHWAAIFPYSRKLGLCRDCGATAIPAQNGVRRAPKDTVFTAGCGRLRGGDETKRVACIYTAQWPVGRWSTSRNQTPSIYNGGLLNKMADGPCPATNQQAWKDRSGAVAGSIPYQELPRQLNRRCNTRRWRQVLAIADSCIAPSKANESSRSSTSSDVSHLGTVAHLTNS